MVRAFAIMIAALMLMVPSASTAAPAVTWPQGWQLRDSPVPTSNSGELFGGSNRLALKANSQGQVLAALNLIVLVIKQDEKPTLENQTASLAATMRAAYAAKGMTSSCKVPQDAVLGGFPAKQMLCSVLKNNTEILEQLLIVTVGQRTVQALSFAVSPDNFETYKPDFIATRDSLLVD